MSHNYFEGQTFVQGDLKISNVLVYDELGRGNSRVYAITINNVKFAMKQLQITSDYQYHNFLKEISMLKTLSTQTSSLIKYEGYFVTVAKEQPLTNMKKYAYIVMEYAQMNLSNLIAIRMAEDSVRFNVAEIESIILTLIKGFSDLEKNNVAHCDIKPENILILHTEDLQIKICDVGSSKVADSSSFEEATIQGTLPFVAPEVLSLRGKKLISLNPFKSDVFSFGLLLLYLVLGKKFPSQERLEIDNQVYREIIEDWIQEASELVQSDILENVLKQSLSFDAHRRSLFKELKILAEGLNRRKKMLTLSRLSKQEAIPNENKFEQPSFNKREDEEKPSKLPKLASLQPFTRSSGTASNFQTRKRLVGKISVKASNYNKKQNSQQKKKRKYSNETNKVSPGNTIRNGKMKTTFSSQFSIDRSRATCIKMAQRIFYVDKQTHQFIPYQSLEEKEKIFVLMDALVGFENAKVVSILKTCPIKVLYKLAQTKGKAFHLEYEKYEGPGVDQNAPMLDYQKVYINLQGSNLSGGYNNLLRSLCPIYLKKLHLRLTGSQITFKEVSMEMERLKNREISRLRLSWGSNFMSLAQHQELIEKIAKLPLKDLQLDQNSNFIQYKCETRWKLPPNLKSLSLNYSDNFLGPIFGSLAISLKDLQSLNDLSLNFSHNSLNDTEIKVLIRSLLSIPSLDRLHLDFSMNSLSNGLSALQDLLQLKTVRSLELRVNKCGLHKNQCLSLIQRLVVLFDKKLKLLKIAIDRMTTKKDLQNQLDSILSENNLRAFIVPYDYKCFMIYFQKKARKIQDPDKTQTIRIRTKKEIFKAKEIYKQGQREEKEKDKKPLPLCSALYTSEPSSQTYICLSCSVLKQQNKYSAYCKACITSCEHQQRSKHRVIRSGENNKLCSCPYNSKCIAEGDSLNVCAEVLGIHYKQIFFCSKCRLNLCQFCAIACRESHQEAVNVSKGEKHRTFFRCGITDKEMKKSRWI